METVILFMLLISMSTKPDYLLGLVCSLFWNSETCYTGLKAQITIIAFKTFKHTRFENETIEIALTAVHSLENRFVEDCRGIINGLTFTRWIITGLKSYCKNSQLIRTLRVSVSKKRVGQLLYCIGVVIGWFKRFPVSQMELVSFTDNFIRHCGTCKGLLHWAREFVLYMYRRRRFVRLL